MRPQYAMLLIFLLFMALAMGYLIRYICPIASSYAAKTACSCLFVAERAEDDIKQDLHPVSYVRLAIDWENKSVSGHVWGLARRTAVYRQGLGCTLLTSASLDEVKNQGLQNPRKAFPGHVDSLWPQGDRDAVRIPKGVDSLALEEAMEWSFAETNPKTPLQTRGIVVLYQGKIVAERYAEGFDIHRPQRAWSMVKSVTNALTGILVREGKLDIHKPTGIQEWQNHPQKRQITVDMLLRMSSGLAFQEVYGWDSHATRMLFRQKDAAAYAASLKQAYAPDTEWNYSSGTSNILSRLIRDQFTDVQAYLAFPYRELFDKIGMRSAQLEVDASGTYVGSSFMMASPRDWARFGLLYLNDGVWMGERILPEGWVSYSRTRTPSAPQGQYGAHFWTNALKEVPGPARKYWPEVPEDAYYANGHEGQHVLIIPSRQTVIVRMGMTPQKGTWKTGVFADKILRALPQEDS
ncbi:MAG: serine hydrolase [Bacteroidota bacterium]